MKNKLARLCVLGALSMSKKLAQARSFPTVLAGIVCPRGQTPRKGFFDSLCALGALCLLTITLTANAQGMPSAAMGGDSETSTVSAASVTGGSGGGGGGGSSEETRTVSHARSTVTSTIGYNALELTVDSAPSTQLIVGGVTLSLTLTAQDGTALPFTPSLSPWLDMEHAESAEETGHTQGETALVVTAAVGETDHWAFDGATLRKLRNSGVSWLVLASEKQTLAVPTEGFLGGYHYDQWRGAGVAAKDIRYTVATDALTLQAAAGGESYQASANTEDMLYYAGIASQGSGVNNIE